MPLPDSAEARLGVGMAGKPVISELDPGDDAGLREYYAVEEAAFRVDHPYVVLRTFPQLVQMVRRPSPYYRRTLLVAREAGRITGTADLGLTTEDNLHLADLEVRVLPEARRRGIGRALHDETLRRARAARRTTFLSEVNQPLEGAPSPAYEFATALGYDVVHEQDHHVLFLPVAAESLSTQATVPEGYEIITWRNRAPEELVAAFAAMHTQMGRDLPTGEVDHEPVEITVKRVREGEERSAGEYDHVVAVARRTRDGVLGGYTLVHLAHDADYVVQDDTLVMPDHRGHGLGMALKVTVLRILAVAHPERRVIHTWNAVENAPMQRINKQLGFRPVERELEVQRRDGNRIDG
jgi:GNAT superfamily N-acetyltransferase